MTTTHDAPLHDGARPHDAVQHDIPHTTHNDTVHTTDNNTARRAKQPQRVNLTVRRTPDFAEDLALLTNTVQPDGTTLTATAAVHHAVRLLADAHRHAWDYGDVPEGTAPTILGIHYAESPDHTPVRRLPNTSDRAEGSDTMHAQPAHPVPDQRTTRAE